MGIYLARSPSTLGLSQILRAEYRLNFESSPRSQTHRACPSPPTIYLIPHNTRCAPVYSPSPPSSRFVSRMRYESSFAKQSSATTVVNSDFFWSLQPVSCVLYSRLHPYVLSEPCEHIRYPAPTFHSHLTAHKNTHTHSAFN